MSGRPRAASRLQRYLPWSDGTGRRWPGWRRAAPFLFVYLIVSWALFLPQARPVPGNWVIDTDRVRPWLYDIPNLSQNFPRFLQSMVTATWLNHNVVQLAYVTFLLLVVGVRFEAREGDAPHDSALFQHQSGGGGGGGSALASPLPGYLVLPAGGAGVGEAVERWQRRRLWVDGSDRGASTGALAVARAFRTLGGEHRLLVSP